jgi:hypothetical protein
MSFRAMPNANIDAPVSLKRRRLKIFPRGPFTKTILIPGRGLCGQNILAWPLPFTKAFKSFI